MHLLLREEPGWVWTVLTLDPAWLADPQGRTSRPSCMWSPGGSWEWATLTGQPHITVSLCVQSACLCHPGEVAINSQGNHHDLVPVLLTRKSRPSDIASLAQVTQLVSQSHICTPVCGTTFRAVIHDDNWPQGGVTATMCLWLKDNFRTFYTVNYLTVVWVSCGCQVTSYEKCCGLKQQECILTQLRKPEVWNSGVGGACFLWRLQGAPLPPPALAPAPPFHRPFQDFGSITPSRPLSPHCLPACPLCISVCLSSSNKDVSHWIESPP